MAHYKNAKHSALMLFSLCMSLDAFGATAVSASLEEEKGDMQPKKVRIEIPASIQSSGPADFVLPTREEMQEGLARKAKVLITELPKAKASLESIEGILVARARGLQSTNFLRASELAGLVSSVKMLSSSLYNTVNFAARDCASDDDLGMLGIVVIGSSALKQELIQFADILWSKEDTKDIDCRVLRDVSAQIHEITKDIDANLQDFPLSDY